MIKYQPGFSDSIPGNKLFLFHSYLFYTFFVIAKQLTDEGINSQTWIQSIDKDKGYLLPDGLPSPFKGDYLIKINNTIQGVNIK